MAQSMQATALQKCLSQSDTALNSSFSVGILVVSQLVSSQLDGNLGGLHFTIPDVRGNFDYAASWCKTNDNSTLAVVNNNSQLALARFLITSNWNSTLFINVKLNDKSDNTWFLIYGSTYPGYVLNQEPRNEKYLFYCRLKYDTDGFKVEASAPSDFINYICDYEENRCSNYSANCIVYNGRCYMKYENESLTWYQARERCINSGGDLAQFKTTSYYPLFETSWLNKSLTYWVGIRWNDRIWKSSDGGDEYISTSWSNGEPNNYTHGCVCVDPNGSPPWSWTDADCTTERQFVCLKKADVQLTTTATPTTTAPTWTTDNYNVTTTADRTNLIIGLAAGIGGGGLLLIIVVIVVLVVIIKRRQRNKEGSRPKLESSGGGIEKIQTDVGLYAEVVSNGNNHGTNTGTANEIVYASPVFAENQNPQPTDHDYAEVDLIRETDAGSTLRGQTRSIFPQRFSDTYANSKGLTRAT